MNVQYNIHDQDIRMKISYFKERIWIPNPNS